MAYTVEQKIKGNIYLYKATSYWDKNKKQSRQKREYIGPKVSKRQRKTKIRYLVSKIYGDVYLLNNIAENLGLSHILKEIFKDRADEILALAYYAITESAPSYLFNFWQEEHYLPQIRKLHPSDISSLYDEIGMMEKHRFDFMIKWTEKLKPIDGIYYDISSISSYSNNIEYIEWGYNRDNEDLPQLNIGLVCDQNKTLPFFYNVFPGSIVDVGTLKNHLKCLGVLNLKDI